jgi:hypothetical protein
MNHQSRQMMQLSKIWRYAVHGLFSRASKLEHLVDLLGMT